MAIRPPNPGEHFIAVVIAYLDDVQAQNYYLKEKADQRVNVGLQPLCDQSDYIWQEMLRLRCQEPLRLLRVWNYVEEYRELLLDIHITIDRSSTLPSQDIHNFCDDMRNILADIRNLNAGTTRNGNGRRRSGTNCSIVQGVKTVHLSGGHYTINNYNGDFPELVHFLWKQFRYPCFCAVLF